MARIDSLIQASKAAPPLVGSILVLLPQTKDALASMLSLTASDLALLAILLPVVTIVVAVNVSRTRSRLSTPGQLVRLAENEKQQKLETFRADAELLSHEILRQQQVYLVGSAGVGKSTMIGLALLDMLRSRNRLCPIYVQALGDGDEQAEAASLAAAVWASLSEQQLTDIGIAPAATPQAVFELLDRLHQSGVIPLIIFDHFDDYVGTNLYWISSAEASEDSGDSLNVAASAADIRQRSAFWNEIARRVESNSLKTVHVATPDMTGFVNAFRFGSRVSQCPLFELPSSAVDAEMSAVESELQKCFPIHAPENGWTMLRRRLVADLTSRQTCLPHQFVTALQGLILLPSVTPEVYRAAGGLLGLCSLALDVAAQEIASSEIPNARHSLQPSGAPELPEWPSELVLVVCAALFRLPGMRARLPEIIGQVMELWPPALPPIPAAALSLETHWEMTLDRLRRRRLVRVRRESAAGPPVYELRHPYVGAAAQLALDRRSPLSADLASRAAAHGAAATVAEWWRTLLPVTQLWRFCFARATSRFRFGSYRRYAMESCARLGIWIVLPLAYVILADTMMPLPFGDSIRSGLDSVGVTFFRQPADVSVSLAGLRRVRDDLGTEVVRRCEATRWCVSLDGTEQFHEEPWTTSQALAAISAFPKARAARKPWMDDSLHALFESPYKIVTAGRTVGWTLGSLSDCPVVEPSLWLSIALARVSGNETRSAQLIADLPKWSAEIQDAVDAYSVGSPISPAPLIEFDKNVAQNRTAYPSIYATSLDLLRDVELARFNRAARPRVASTVRWLMAHKRRGGPHEPADGWQPADYVGEEISEGVTMQVLYALLRARSVVPDAVPAAVPELSLKWLRYFLTVDDPFRETVSFYYGDYLGPDGKPKSYGHVVRFAWLPFAVGTAIELQHSYVAHASSGRRLTVARALDHFNALTRKDFSPVLIPKHPTYKLTELLFTLGSIDAEEEARL